MGEQGESLTSRLGDHTCSLLSDGTVKCWGSNASGQLGDRAERDSSPAQRGDGTTANRLTPVPVSNLP